LHGGLRLQLSGSVKPARVAGLAKLLNIAANGGIMETQTQPQTLFPMEAQAGMDFGKPLTESYAPKNLSEMLGLEKQKRILAKLAANPKAGAAILMEGDSGTGKTTAGFLYLKSIGAEIHHIPSQSATVDNLKSTIDRCWYVPMAGKSGWHGILIDEADKLTPQAMLAMLSVLDGTNCPPQTVFVLTCNSVENFQDRFLGRCLRLPSFNTYGASSSIKQKLAAIWKDRAGDAPMVSLEKVPTSSVRAAYQWLEVELLSV
jgi:hypothetical protein